MNQYESQIQNKILKNLKSIGIYAHKNIATNKKGVPDIICCVDGKYVALEVKKKGGKPSDLQIWNINKIRNSGGVAETVYSWEDVKDILERLNYGN